MLNILLLAAALQFVSPVHDDHVTLAGNFGEPRPHHFHGGIDVKTDNVEGKQIFSIADGYVSRLTVNMYGFGNAIYVSHPDGMTSVYCHLKRFADKYEQQLTRTGWRDTLSVVFPKDQFPVKAGELIAISGNTGHSTGPHLHLELQRQILPLLTSVFPNIQFVVSTHSPFVLNSIKDAVAYDMERHEVIGDLTDYSYESLAEGYFGVKTNSVEIEVRLERLEELLKKGDALDVAEKDEMKRLQADFENLSELVAPSLKGKYYEISRKYQQ